MYIYMHIHACVSFIVLNTSTLLLLGANFKMAICHFGYITFRKLFISES